jgi:hypothetical protein
MFRCVKNKPRIEKQEVDIEKHTRKKYISYKTIILSNLKRCYNNKPLLV